MAKGDDLRVERGSSPETLSYREKQRENDRELLLAKYSDGQPNSTGSIRTEFSVETGVHQPNQCEDASAQALRHSLFEGIQDGHIEVREITFVPSGHGEAMNASRGGHHGVLT
jgi:hypothetical protein